jgi:hypothetical protein
MCSLHEMNAVMGVCICPSADYIFKIIERILIKYYV